MQQNDVAALAANHYRRSQNGLACREPKSCPLCRKLARDSRNPRRPSGAVVIDLDIYGDIESEQPWL